MNTDLVGFYRQKVRECTRTADRDLTIQKLQARDGDPRYLGLIHRYYLKAMALAATCPILILIAGMILFHKLGYSSKLVNMFVLVGLAGQLSAIGYVSAAFLIFDLGFTWSHRWQIIATKVAQEWKRANRRIEDLQAAAELDIEERRSFLKWILGGVTVLATFAELKKVFFKSEIIGTVPSLPWLTSVETFYVGSAVLIVTFYVTVYVRLEWAKRIGAVIQNKAFTEPIDGF